MLTSLHSPETVVSGGGGMGALIRNTDWTSTGVGPMGSWPQSFRTALGMILDS